MAKTTVIQLTDDIDGASKGVEEVQFSIDGRLFRIDLKEANRNRLYRVLKPFMDNAQEVNLANIRPKSTNPSAAPEKRMQNRAVREWARTNGFDINVNSPGRIPDYIHEAFDKAHQT